MKKLFGTDGIRGRAGEFPLDPASMFALGESLAHRFRGQGSAEPLVLLGMDTRESGPDIARALMAGLVAGGGRGQMIGVIPTPGVAYLCRKTPNADAAISISASHNPFEDNGVKVFGHDGMKLSDELEKSIEEEMMSIRKDRTVEGQESLPDSLELIQRYEDFLLEGLSRNSLEGQRVVLDTGHGAAFRIAPDVFRRAGADVIVMNDRPDGRNINKDAGALHPEKLAQRVVSEKAHLGVAFDGDADRAIFADDKGVIRNGDEILYLWAEEKKRAGLLTNELVVATVMSNLGFEKRLEASNIKLVRAAVGDKYVLELMLKHGASIGGEQSGHIIDLDVHTTGDGVHTALSMARIFAERHQPFSSLETFIPYPQILRNLRVRSKPPLESLTGYQAAEAEGAKLLAGDGRILVRYSGTENLVRVMVEGSDAGRIDEVGELLFNALKDEIGE